MPTDTDDDILNFRTFVFIDALTYVCPHLCMSLAYAYGWAMLLQFCLPDLK